MKRADYERKADEAVSAFLDQGRSLESSIVKMAHRDKLNPEQIKRIVEMANTGTFLKMFSLKDGPDKIVDFEVADPQKTVDSFYGKSSADKEDTPSSEDVYYCDVEDENVAKDLGSAADDAEEKVASVASKDELRREQRRKDESTIRMWKVAEAVKDRAARKEYEASDCADALAQKFRGIYSRPKHAEFEKNALALHGPEAVYALNAVRTRLKMKEYDRLPNEDLVKEASARYVVDGKSEGMPEVESFLGCVADYRQCQKALATLG